MKDNIKGVTDLVVKGKLVALTGEEVVPIDIKWFVTVPAVVGVDEVRVHDGEAELVLKKGGEGFV